MVTTGKPSLAISRTSSRREALRTGSVGVAAAFGLVRHSSSGRAQEATPVSDEAHEIADPADGLSQEILEAFRVLPGQHGLKLWAPPDAGRPAWSVGLNPEDQFFIASAFKGFVLAECLRFEEESLDPRSEIPIAAQLSGRLGEQLTLDEGVFSLDSSVFNPPYLSGQVSLRTAMEAMISHSDNTATDMVLKHVGAERVQSFVDGLGLQQTRIPTSTRQFLGYIFGLDDWRNTTWADLQNPTGTPRPILDDQITMASSPDNLVDFYARALRGELFQYAETLAVFRGILGMADAIPASMPLGVSAFGKGGAIAYEGSNALTFAGGVYVPDRWVYFALLLNWTDEEAGSGASVQGSYVAAARSIFDLVVERLGA
jgi:beta-lactamase class A